MVYSTSGEGYSARSHEEERPLSDEAVRGIIERQAAARRGKPDWCRNRNEHHSISFQVI